jgi:hypothetical protein
MHPQGQLTELNRRKDQLRLQIARHRALCSNAAGILAQPLAVLDGVHRLWLRIAPLVRFASRRWTAKPKAGPFNWLWTLLRWTRSAGQGPTDFPPRGRV